MRMSLDELEQAAAEAGDDWLEWLESAANAFRRVGELLLSGLVVDELWPEVWGELLLDALEQRAADVQLGRHVLRLAQAIIARAAESMGQGAVKSIAGYFRWSAQDMARLRLLLDLPPSLIHADAPLGIYWAATQAFEGPELEERLREALRDDWSVTKARREWGLTEPKEPPDKPVLDCEARLQFLTERLAVEPEEGGYLQTFERTNPAYVLEGGDELADLELPARARVQAWEVKDE